MHIAYIILGGNIGDVVGIFSQAEKLVEKGIGQIIKQSAVYETKAWGYEEQPDFLNKILKISTSLAPMELMKSCLNIETQLGRQRTFKNSPRIIDIDILYYDKEIISKPGLEIPHPRIANRRFVLVPMNELAANFKDPVYKKTIHELLTVCTDPLEVAKLD